MPKTCIAIGCTSGYPSNYEKKHFFHVPKNVEKARLWQEACKRRDIMLKPWHVFCENHFKENDIIKKKVFLDKSGKVIQEIPLAKFRLKEDTVPSLFPWVELPNNEFCLQSKENDDIAVEGPQSPAKVFTYEYLKMNTNLDLPASWGSQIISHDHKQIMIFNKFATKNIDGEMKIYNQKDVVIGEDLHIKVHILGKEIDLIKFGYKEKVLSSIKALTDLIKVIDHYNVCTGYDFNSYEYSSASYRDRENVLRHNNCSLMIKSGKVCSSCKTLYNTLSQKKRRQSVQESSKRVCLSKLSPCEKSVFQEIRKQKNDLSRINTRLVNSVQLLKSDLKEMQKKLTNISEDNLLNISNKRE